MAVVVETLVIGASKAAADQLDELIERSIGEMGGPPAGLMVHIGRPADGGYLLCQVWRTEPEMRSFYDEVVLPHLDALGLEAQESQSWPAWSFARP